MRFWLALVLATCVPQVAWGQGRTGGGTQATQAVKKADKAFAAKRLGEAIRLYNLALAADRSLTSAYEKLAIAYYAVGQHRAAVSKLSVCLQVAPNNVQCLQWMGMHLLKLGRRAAGIAALQRAVRLSWKLPLAMRELGRHYYRRANWRRAEKAWWTFLKFRDRSWPARVDFIAYLYLGKIYLKMKRYPAAATTFTRATRLRKKHTGARLGLARAYLGRRYFNAALNLLLPLRKLARQRPVIDFYLARCFHRMHRKRQALRSLKRYTARRPGDVRALILRGDIHFQHGEFGAALAAYKLATVRAPASMEARVKYGEALLRRKRNVEAHAVLSVAAKRQPQNPQVLRALARALLALGRAPQAVSVLTRLLRVRPSSAEGAALRGDAYLLAGQPDRAIADYRTARRLNKRSWRAKAGLIRALTHRAQNRLTHDNPTAALADLRRALALDPRRLVTNTNLGIAYLMANRPKEAERHLLRAKKRLPRSFAVNRLLGRLYHTTGKPRRALAHYVKARLAAKKLPVRLQAEVELELGALLAAQRDLDTAVKVLQNAVVHAAATKDLAPLAQGDLAIALLDRGYRHLEKGQGKKAVADLERARGYAHRLSGSGPELLRLGLALAYLETRRWAKAAAAFGALTRRGVLARVLRPPFDRLDATYFKAYTRYRRGGYKAAAKALERLLRRVKGPANKRVRLRLREIIRSAHELRAAQLLHKGKPGQAVQLYRRARRYRLSRAGRNNQAVAWYRSGHKRKALAAWIKGGTATGLCNVGTHHDNAGRPRAAYTWYQKCAARGGANASIQRRIKIIQRLFGFKKKRPPT